MTSLKNAARVELLSIARTPSNSRNVDHAKAYLGLHGIGCAGRVVEQGERSIADALLEAAAGFRRETR